MFSVVQYSAIQSSAVRAVYASHPVYSWCKTAPATSGLLIHLFLLQAILPLHFQLMNSLFDFNFQYLNCSWFCHVDEKIPHDKTFCRNIKLSQTLLCLAKRGNMKVVYLNFRQCFVLLVTFNFYMEVKRSCIIVAIISLFSITRQCRDTEMSGVQFAMYNEPCTVCHIQCF